MSHHDTLHLHIDMIGGLAGDMFIAAALHAGLVSAEELSEAFSTLGLGTIKVLVASVVRYGIESAHVSFMGWDASQERDHRHLSEITRMIAQSSLDESVKSLATQMFTALGEVEAKTHDIPLETVHFHEIGAIDSILDFVGAAYIIDKLQATWSASEVPVGEGTVQMSHGPMPAMAPATAKLLRGFTLKPTGLHAELVTPTSATILKTLGVQIPGLSVTGVLKDTGFGAGSKDFDGTANVVRLSIYQLSSQQGDTFQTDRVTRLEADVDDESPEIMAHAERLLLEAGALDVTRHAVMMKKGRMGTRLGVLCLPADAQKLAHLVFEHTSTFGVRIEEISRWVLSRELQTVETEYGEVTVKLGRLGTRVMTISAEDDSCAARAREHGVAIGRVHDAARRAAHALWN